MSPLKIKLWIWVFDDRIDDEYSIEEHLVRLKSPNIKLPRLNGRKSNAQTTKMPQVERAKIKRSKNSAAVSIDARLQVCNITMVAICMPIRVRQHLEWNLWFWNLWFFLGFDKKNVKNTIFRKFGGFRVVCYSHF